MTEPNYKQILINLIAGLHLADHMGDVASDVWEALSQADLLKGKRPLDFDEMRDMAVFLGAEYGATTLYGTQLTDDEYRRFNRVI